MCLVAEMTFDGRGQRLTTELYPAVMRSAARCTYEEVQAVLDGQPVPQGEIHSGRSSSASRALGRRLRRLREERGAVDFDLPEVRPELDAHGRPVRMVRRERKESHRIVEDCMLAANEAVAAWFQSQELPSVYRFHAEPDPDKLAAFTELAKAQGFSRPRQGPAHLPGPEPLHAQAGGSPRAAGAEPAVAPLDDAGGVLAGPGRALRAGRGGIPALHLAHPALPRPPGAPAASAPTGSGAGGRGRRASWATRWSSSGARPSTARSASGRR